jgi:thiol:disulfide interchange protein
VVFYAEPRSPTIPHSLNFKVTQEKHNRMTKKQKNKMARRQKAAPQYLILAGFILLLAVVFSLKDQPGASEPAPNAVAGSLLPEAQLNQALEAGQPVLAFFHSTTCYQCNRMIEIVEAVYADYAASVTLVDVDVYADENVHLLRRAQIRTIPTVILFDRAGQEQVYLGVMEAHLLRQQLSAISER